MIFTITECKSVTNPFIFSTEATIMDKTDSRALYEMKLTTGMSYIYGPEGTKAHAQAIEEDKDKSYRMVVNIVGKVAQGKTSLRRMLVGEEFNEREQSTVGIEHELVEILGTSPDPANYWAKVDLFKANLEECDLIVGKHVRNRLRKNQHGNIVNAEIKSLIKAILLSYFMLFIYFTHAETESLADFPWFPFMFIVSLAFSGLFLFDTMRDGFGMAVGTLCLVIYCDCLIRQRLYELPKSDTESATHVISFLLNAVLSFSAIHAVMAFSMGISMAMGLCVVLASMKPPWNSQTTENNVFLNPHFHIFVLSVLAGIWSLRCLKIRAILIALGSIALLTCILPLSWIYCTISGLFCGFAHAMFIKIGFSAYINFINPMLKKVADERRGRRLLCYVFGAIPGFLLVSYLDWKRPSNVVLYIACGLLVVVFVEICHFVLEGKTAAAPTASIKNATKVLNSLNEASLKFVVRDFAGHQLYHSVHHIYMMGHCIYLICFSFIEAKRNFRTSFADILYWLQAIFVHDRYPNVRVFIVGTHRDDSSLSKDDIVNISDEILNKLPRQFHNMIVWNQNEQPVFPVENSIRNDKDPDHARLRHELFRLANGTMKPKYPIKYLYFYRVLNECRETGQLIETLDNIDERCKNNDCVLNKAGEMEDLLCYFHECGEIIYNSMDNNQNQLVVMDPKALVSIMSSLVRAPPRAERDPDFIRAWQTVADIGIASKRLLYHIISNNPVVGDNVEVKVVIALLEYLDLVCKLDLGIDGRDALGEKCYLITPLIKDTLPYPQNYWPDMRTDTILYIDFGPVVPKFVFTRLVCQCTAESHINIGTDGRYHLNVSTSKALFTCRESHCFKLELLDVAQKASPSQQLLKITVRGSNQDECWTIAQRICRKVCTIVERDFRKCRYKIGVMCPFEGPHDYCQYEVCFYSSFA